MTLNNRQTIDDILYHEQEVNQAIVQQKKHISNEQCYSLIKRIKNKETRHKFNEINTAILTLYTNSYLTLTQKDKARNKLKRDIVEILESEKR